MNASHINNLPRGDRDFTPPLLARRSRGGSTRAKGSLDGRSIVGGPMMSSRITIGAGQDLELGASRMVPGRSIADR
jgi:hypothetical protein